MPRPRAQEPRRNLPHRHQRRPLLLPRACRSPKPISRGRPGARPAVSFRARGRHARSVAGERWPDTFFIALQDGQCTERLRICALTLAHIPNALRPILHPQHAPAFGLRQYAPFPHLLTRGASSTIARAARHSRTRGSCSPRSQQHPTAGSTVSDPPPFRALPLGSVRSPGSRRYIEDATCFRPLQPPAAR
jgi:hypothetical protein